MGHSLGLVGEQIGLVVLAAGVQATKAYWAEGSMGQFLYKS